MSCFFDAIFVRLTPEWKEKVGSSSRLPAFFADNNVDTHNILCNGLRLSAKQIQENKAHISQMRNHNVRSGYPTSFYEPYFYLCSVLFDADIAFDYRGHKACFKKCHGASRHSWSFTATSSHIS
jgi:hypothetical protein